VYAASPLALTDAAPFSGAERRSQRRLGISAVSESVAESWSVPVLFSLHVREEGLALVMVGR
jgi:hypothetical protein